MEKESESIRSSTVCSEQEMEELRSKVVDLEKVKIDLLRIREEVDVKESEIEDKIRENEVLKVSYPSQKTMCLITLPNY
jgi:hypothetical protein